MALPSIFLTVDAESAHFRADVPAPHLRKCLGHLNRVTPLTFGAHQRRLAAELRQAPAAVPAFAELMLGKVATEPVFVKMYADMCVQLAADLADHPGPPLLPLLIDLASSLVRTPPPPSESAEALLRQHKGSALAFLGAVGAAAEAELVELLGHFRGAVQGAELSVPQVPSAVVLHPLRLLCTMLATCGQRLQSRSPAEVRLAVEAVRGVARLEHFATAFPFAVQFQVGDTLGLAAAGWVRPQPLIAVWNLDRDELSIAG